jgi:hypothetical protein
LIGDCRLVIDRRPVIKRRLRPQSAITDPQSTTNQRSTIIQSTML